MAIYELGVGDEMGYNCWLFEHDSKTPEQFEEDCHKAIQEVGGSVIENEDFIVEVYDWLEAILSVLESWGYKRVRPAKVSFYSERLNYVSEDSEWRKEVGVELYDKAVKAGFERWVAYHANDSYFVVYSEEERIYHRANCLAFRDQWQEPFYAFPKENFVTNETLADYKQCPECFGEQS
jgi:hypothetical protein